MKGATEYIIEACDYIISLEDGKIRVFTKELKIRVN